jgi:hypothetical protein
LEFSIDHNEDGDGEAWDTLSLTSAVADMLRGRFEHDGLEVDKLTAEQTVTFSIGGAA